MTPKVGGTGQHLIAVNHHIMTEAFRVLNKQKEAFTQVVQLEGNGVPDVWQLITRPSGNDERAYDLHQLCGVEQLRLLYSLMN